MTKAKTPPMDESDNLPPMPGAENDPMGESGSPSTFSTEDSPQAVDEGLAGDLIALPFEAWAVFETRVPHEVIVLSEKQKQFLGGPVSRVLTKYGLGKIAKDEVVIVAVLSMHTFGIVSALSKAKKNPPEITEPAQ